MALNLGVTDAKAEIDGMWVDFPFNPSIKLKIARFMNHAHEQALKRLRKPYEGFGKTMTDAQQTHIFLEALAETVLLDWKGVKEGSKVVKYTPEEGFKALNDPAYRDFKEFVVSASADMNTFRKERVEAAGKP